MLAGGTDVYPQHVGRPMTTPMIDIGGLADLRGIDATADTYQIGALTRWADVAGAALPPRFDGLRAAAGQVGAVQVQNAATVGGNLCNASPAADGTPVLLALGARVVLQSARGERELALDEFVLGSRRTALGADELVVAVRIPARSARARSAFAKLGGRRYLTISISTVAVVVDVDADGTIAEAGVAVGSCSAVAQRLPALEARLVGVAVDAELADLLDVSDLAPLTPIDDLRGSAVYRRDATATLVRRALREVASA